MGSKSPERSPSSDAARAAFASVKATRPAVPAARPHPVGWSPPGCSVPGMLRARNGRELASWVAQW